MTSLVESMAQEAADAIDPKLFEPAIRKAADDFYDQLLTGVQDYLKDNVQFNLSSHILMLESTVKQLRAEKQEAADTIEALCEALRAIQNVRVNKHADNIWTGSNKCREIATAALERVS